MNSCKVLGFLPILSGVFLYEKVPNLFMLIIVFLLSVNTLKKLLTKKRLSFCDSPNFCEIFCAKTFFVIDNYVVPVPVPVPVPVAVPVPVPVPVPSSSSSSDSSFVTVTVISCVDEFELASVAVTVAKNDV